MAKPRVPRHAKTRGKQGRQTGHGRRGRGNYTGHVQGARGGRYIEGEGGQPQFEPPPPAPGGQPPPPPDPGQFGWLHLPPDVAAHVSEMIAQGTDPNVIMGWIRTTPWYAQEFAGIQYGHWSNPQNPEIEYQQYKNQANIYSQRYYGRNVTSGDILSYLRSGYSLQDIQGIGAGYADVQAHGRDYQYYAGNFGGGALTPQELEALGRSQAGYNNTLGDRIKSKIDEAIKRYERVFQGTLGSSASLEASIGDTLQRRRTSDIGY